MKQRALVPVMRWCLVSSRQWLDGMLAVKNQRIRADDRTMSRSGHDDGFTMVELLAVLLIISVLIAIGIPMYRGQAASAQDAQAQALLRHALIVQQIHHLENDTYSNNRRTLSDMDPKITWNQRRNPPDTVRVRYRGRYRTEEVCLYTQSESGRYFAVYHHIDDGTRYGETDRVRGCSPRVARNWSTEGW